jgi:two-component sensor histidine kinase
MIRRKGNRAELREAGREARNPVGKEKSSAKKTNSLLYLAIGALLLTLVFVERAVSGSVEERNLYESEAKSDLLDDALIVGSRIDGALRVADTLLVDFQDALARPSLEEVKSFLELMLSRFPEGDAAWVLAADGAPLVTVRGSVAPPIPPALIAKLLSETGSETFIAVVGTERSIAIARAIQRQEGSRISLIVFPSAFLSASLEHTHGNAAQWVELLDAAGGRLGTAVPADTRAKAGALLIETESALPGHALRIHFARDITPTFARLRVRMIATSVFMAIVLAGTLALGFLGLTSRRRAREAEDLRHREELEAREALVHEVNHRVKNNLASVISILDLGIGEATAHPERALDILSAASTRVGSIALLHQLLYQSRSLESVELAPWFDRILAQLGAAYAVAHRIAIRTDVDPRIVLDLKSAVPLGLIVTELVTNALKHGFPAGRHGQVVVEARETPETGLTCRVIDDGIGDAAGVADHGEGFGTTLVEGLARQLGARALASTTAGGGLTWTIVLAATSGEPAA